MRKIQGNRKKEDCKANQKRGGEKQWKRKKKVRVLKREQTNMCKRKRDSGTERGKRKMKMSKSNYAKSVSLTVEKYSDFT